MSSGRRVVTPLRMSRLISFLPFRKLDLSPAHHYLSTPLAAAVLVLCLAGAASAHVWHESFDSELSSIGLSIAQHPLVSPIDSSGIDGSRAIRVTYQGYERGSRRVVLSPVLPSPAMSYELSFAVKFCDGFDFAKGGKLHGLGPRNPVTGGRPITPQGWSARLMFRQSGGLMTYVYHQDMPTKYGQTKLAPSFRFRPGRYYLVAMRVTLNEPVIASNGKVEVWVNRTKLIEHTGLRFRATDGPDGMIQRLLFSTFHGGDSAEWAPRDAAGAYKEDCAYFDDWTIQ